MTESKDQFIPKQETPNLQKRRERILERLAKDFIPPPKYFAEDEDPIQNVLGGYIFEDLLKKYEGEHPISEKGPVKEWYEDFLKRKKLEIERQVMVYQVAAELGLEPYTIIQEILMDFCESFPFPLKEESREEWRNFLKEACKQLRKD